MHGQVKKRFYRVARVRSQRGVDGGGIGGCSYLACAIVSEVNN
jgi:hypothetical protein